MTAITAAPVAVPVPDNVAHLIKEALPLQGSDDYVFEVVIPASASEGGPWMDLHSALGSDPEALALNAMGRAEREFFVPRKTWREFSTSTLTAVHGSYRMQMRSRRLEA